MDTDNINMILLPQMTYTEAIDNDVTVVFKNQFEEWTKARQEPTNWNKRSFAFKSFYWVMRNRAYYELKYPITLNGVDKPASKGYRTVTDHPSEHGWALHRNHPRHLLNFPLDILYMILSFTTTAPNPASLSPFTAIANQKCGMLLFDHYTATWLFPNCKINNLPHLGEVYSWRKRCDAHGSYFIQRKVRTPALDGTILRTCKVLDDIGSPIMYGYNNFSFKMVRKHDHNCRWHLINGKPYRPDPRKPQAANWVGEIKEGLNQIQHNRPITMLQGWLYFDPFLRWLHSIGMQRAQSVRHLTFNGMVKIHRCQESPCGGNCDDDLVLSIHLYFPFIRTFFTDLRKITIVFEHDYMFLRNPHPLRPDQPATSEEALRRLYQKSLSKIPSLRQLEILETWNDDGRPSSFATSFPAIFAEEMLEAVGEKSQASFHHTSKISKLRLDNTSCPARNSGSRGRNWARCQFCQEFGHVWAECYNLCSYCGEFGHFLSSCPWYDGYENQW
ncbi:hypothetical protein BJ875DRAFT_545950 [Amylocarpus encephaloides]|uniref:CCHC-type domain-containing protein n=1 Tax=Amylocarpus encephaloides TaxID=45428 RepID=A0A9P7YC47_9HELO|nr:hypothetical protein BJ875DRAFT_545950 [Amylocarpus encephaloides]